MNASLQLSRRLFVVALSLFVAAAPVRAEAPQPPRRVEGVVPGARSATLGSDPSDTLVLLDRVGERESEVLHAALAKHPDRARVHALVAALLEPPEEPDEDEGRPEKVRDLDGLARWFFDRYPEDSGLVMRCFRHPSPYVRARAVEASGRLAGRRARDRVRMIERLLKDEHFIVRAHVARALSRVRHDVARTLLVFQSRDEEPLVRVAAVRGLGDQDPYHVVPVLRRAARDTDRWVRNAARVSLVRQGMLDAVSALLNDLGDVALGYGSRRALATLVSTPCVTREQFERALDRERPDWRRLR